MFPSDKQMDRLFDRIENIPLIDHPLGLPVLLVSGLGILVILDLRDHCQELRDIVIRAKRFLASYRLVVRIEPRGRIS